MKHLFLILSLTFSFLYGASTQSLTDLAKPLFKADAKFKLLPKEKLYSPKVLEYHQKQAELRKLSQGDKKNYFKALRTLTKEHDTIISLAKREMINSIRNDDILSFQALNEARLEEFYRQESFRKKIFTYYIENRDRYMSTFLDKKINSEKSYHKQYGVDVTGPSSNSDNTMVTTSQHKRPSKVIVLSRPGCPWCTKTKDFLKSKHISYIEYNVQTSSKGKALFKKYKGSGVPLTIIGDTVLRGYDPDGIMGAI